MNKSNAKSSNAFLPVNERFVAFIPARGGSKSIPLKNIRLFCGKPLLYWTVKAACESQMIDQVYVATDDGAIDAALKQYSFERLCVIGRSADTATDTASTESAMLEFAEKIKFGHIVLIQATSPLLETCDIDGGIAAYLSQRRDSLLSAVRQKRFIWQESGGAYLPKNYDPRKRPRRQDMSGYLVENGAFYITSKQALFESRTRLSGTIGVYEMTEDAYFEIDEPSDWKIAEGLKWERLKNIKKKSAAQIRLLVCDVDGVLTDAGMYYDAEGGELKKFNARDGKGLAILRDLGIKVMLLTSEDTGIVKRRAEKLKADFLCMGVLDKKMHLDQFYRANPEFSYATTAYIGDDINDLEAMRETAFSAAPRDGAAEVARIADYICRSKGGNGCVREFCDIIARGGDCANASLS